MRSMLARGLFCSMLMLPVLAVAQEAAEAPEAVATEVAVADAVPAADDVAATVDVAAAPVAPAASNGMIGPAPEGLGQIVFFRPAKFSGGAIGFKVREGEVELGKLRSGKYFVANVEPGVHEYVVHSEAKDILTMEVEAGETYYVQGTLTMGILAGRPNLSPSDEATFNGMSKKLKLAK